MKKIFALLLSVAMVTSMFVGVAFAAAPTVTFSPADGATDMALTVTPTITFSAAVRNFDDSIIDPTTLLDSITFTTPGTPPVDVPFTAAINAAGTVITVTPDAPLAAGVAHTLGFAANTFEATATGHAVVAAASATFTAGRTGNSITAVTVPGAIGTYIRTGSANELTNTDNVIVITMPPTATGSVTPGVTHGAGVSVTPTAIALNASANLVVTSEAGVARTYRVSVVHPWLLNASIASGTVALNSTVVITGAVTTTAQDTTTIHRVEVQRRAPGSAEWTNTGISRELNPANNHLRQFSIPFTFTQAGDYRLALLGSNHANAVALWHSGAAVAHAIGSIGAQPITVTASATTVFPNASNQVTVDITAIRQAQGGVPVRIVDPAAGSAPNPLPMGVEVGAAFVHTFNGVSINPTETYLEGATRLVYTLTAGQTGTILINVASADLQWAGQIGITVAPRAAFNATTTFTTDVAGELFAGNRINLTTTLFDAAGGNPNSGGRYTMTTVTGPVSAPAGSFTRLRFDSSDADHSTGNLRITAPGTITVTSVLFSADHAEIARVVETIDVRGGLVINLTSARVGQTVTLSATVTDRNGNPDNLARVRFTAAAGTHPFVLRDPNTGLFPATPVGVNAVRVDGWLPSPVRPAGQAVVNGVYTVDVMLLQDAAVTVDVIRLHSAGNPPVFSYESSLGTEATPYINRASGVTIGRRLHSVTANQTTFVTEHQETLTLTVRDASGNLVSGLTTFAVAEAGATFAQAPIAPGVYSGAFLADRAGTFTITAVDSANPVNGIEFAVTVQNPRVVVNTSTTLVTSDFFEVITVSMFDSRLTENVPLNLPLRLTEGRVQTPDQAFRWTAELPTLQTRATATAPWGTLSPTAPRTTSAVTTTGGVPATNEVGNAYNLPRATVHEFRVLTWGRNNGDYRIAGVRQDGTLRYLASHVGAGTAQLFVQTLTPASIALSTSEIRTGVNNQVTLTLRNAHGVAFGSIPEATNQPRLDRNVVATGRWDASFAMPVEGIAPLVIRPEQTTGLVLGNVQFEVRSDRTDVSPAPVALRTDVRVVTPLDVVAPVIEVTAPATTTTATAQILVTVTDENAIDTNGVAFNGVRFYMNATPTFTFVRNVDLVLGDNHFIVSAMDRAENVTNRTITITRTAPPAPPADTAAPVIEVTVPAVTNEATAVVTVTVRDNVNIAANGIIFDGVIIPGFVARESVFTRTVNLREGMNIFNVAAQDAAGNVATRTIAIERRTPPAPVSHVITIGRANPAIGLDVPANVRNGRLMVPFRWFGERILEATVDYRVVGTAEIVTLVKGEISVELTLNSTIAKVNGTPVSLDVAAFATGGRTLVPARFLAETFGYTVNWNPADDSVTITKR